MTSLTAIMVALLFLAPTIQYRVETGLFSFALMEPIALCATVVLIVHNLVRRRVLHVPREWPVLAFVALSAWALLVRPFAVDWKHGLSDIRDWIVPVGAFATLLATVHTGWLTCTRIVVSVSLLAAVLGIYQGFTGNFRPFLTQEGEQKSVLAGGTSEAGTSEAGIVQLCASYSERARLAETTRGSSETTRAETVRQAPPFAVGFFAHPNSLAWFLVGAILLAVGLSDGAKGVLRWLVLSALVVGLVLTYAKTSYVALGFGLVVYWCARQRRARRWLVLAVALMILGLAVCVFFLKPSYLESLCWRYGLWTSAFDAIVRYPSILIVGNGIDAYARLAYYPQPHNLYVYVLLDYGLLGLGLLTSAVFALLLCGWRDMGTGTMQKHHVLAAAWIAALTCLAVIGSTESIFYGIDGRMITLSLVGCYLGLRSELVRPNQAADLETPK